MRKLIIGVCAMDIKARSKPMRSILDRLVGQEPSHFEAIIFGDQVILEDPVEAWPLCDILIAFYSRGFPLDKATAYVNLRQPFCVNDLWMQYVLLDRRLVLAILDAIDVPTPPRLVVNRAPPDPLPERVAETISRDFNLDLASMSADLFPTNLPIHQPDPDILQCGESVIRKPFVEKSADAEDHNVYVYFGSGESPVNPPFEAASSTFASSATTEQQQQLQVPGVRRLFRKVANKSSDFVPNLTQVRQEGSFIYEQFLPIDNCEDVKVYTIGPYYAYAETRKSPVVDGVVIRNAQGKERRQATALTPEEQEMARRICMAFEQTICGFDILRMAGRSYVIDVNGWSLVKGSEPYYDKCGRIFRDTFLRVARRRHPSAAASMLSFAHSLPRSDSILETLTQPAAGQWRLRYFCSVLRHGDRTPKQKFKLTTGNPIFLTLIPPDYQRGTQVSLKERRFLQELLQRCQEALEDVAWQAEHPKYMRIAEILRLKFRLASLKVQLRLVESQQRSLAIIVKWGGEFTHAGRHQSTDLGESMRKELQILNRRILDDVKIYTSEERRVVATAEMFAKAFLPMAEVPPSFVEERRELLDDICIPKEAMDVIKAKLRVQLQKRLVDDHRRYDGVVVDDGQSPSSATVPLTDPSVWVARLIQVLRYHRSVYERKMAAAKEADLLARFRWCCSESPLLFRERWNTIFTDLLGDSSDDATSSVVVSPSRIPDLYDALKYEALHHRPFLEYIFTDADDGQIQMSGPPPFQGLKELFVLVQRLFEYVGPREYGLTAAERLTIGRDISGPLLGSILAGCRQVMSDTKNEINEWTQTNTSSPFIPFSTAGKTRLYFTKESHMIALLNILLNSGIPIDTGQLAVTDEMIVRRQKHQADGSVDATLTYDSIAHPSPSVIPPSSNINVDDDSESTTVTSDASEPISETLHYGELDYLSQICFEFYERIKVAAEDDADGNQATIQPRYSMRIGLSHGAHTPHLMDLEWIPEDGRHALAVTPVKFITGYLEGEEALRILEQII